MVHAPICTFPERKNVNNHRMNNLFYDMNSSSIYRFMKTAFFFKQKHNASNKISILEFNTFWKHARKNKRKLEDHVRIFHLLKLLINNCIYYFRPTVFEE